MDDMLPFSSIDAGIYPTDQCWDATMDLDALNVFTDFGEQSSEQDSVPPSSDPGQTSVPPSKARRRAQNRASQRAFRERKDKHVKGLEIQLESLNEKHQDLLCSYNKQSENVAKLNCKIAALQSNLKTLKSNAILGECDQLLLDGGLPGGRSRGHGHGKTVMPDTFDAFPFTAVTNTTSPTSPMLYDGYELGLDRSIVNPLVTSSTLGGTPRQTDLPDFEDLLQMP